MTGQISPDKRNQIVWTAIIILTVLVTLSSTLYALSRGIYDVFPFVYFLPIILFVYLYPNKGVYFSLALSSVYILLVYVYSGFNPQDVALSTAWFVIFVTIGVVTSSFAEGLREEERKYRGMFENSQAGDIHLRPEYPADHRVKREMCADAQVRSFRAYRCGTLAYYNR